VEFHETIDLVSPRSIKSDVLASPINLVTPPQRIRKKCRRGSPHVPLHMSRDLSIEIVSPHDIKPTRHMLHDSSIEIMSPSDRKPKRRRPVSQDIVIYDAPPHTCEDEHFPTLDAAIAAVYDEEEALGHKWVKVVLPRLRLEVDSELESITA